MNSQNFFEKIWYVVLLASTHTFVAQVVRVGVRVLYGSNFVVRVKLYPCTPQGEQKYKKLTSCVRVVYELCTSL